jgi:hypothetical protein
MKNEDERDDLWQLLGRAKEPAVSPFFSRDVLREIRQQEQERPSFFRRFRLVWGFAGAATACAVAAMLLTQRQSEQQLVVEPDEIVLYASAVSASPDYQVITNLDELLDSEESSVWLDSSTF